MAAFRAGLFAALARSAPRSAVAGRTVGSAWLLPVSSVRAAHDLPPGLLPGSYPRTPEERAEAAKKYNMTVEDYKPYPEEDWGYGDYPMLPEKSQEERDPHYDWDFPDLRMNWGEPLHWDFDKYIRNRVDTSPEPVPFNRMVRKFFGLFAILGTLFYLGYLFPSYQPVAPKQYPYNNLYLEHGGDPAKAPPEVKHYVFK